MKNTLRQAVRVSKKARRNEEKERKRERERES